MAKPPEKPRTPPRISGRLTTRTAHVTTSHRRRGSHGLAAVSVYEPTDFLEIDHGSLYIALEVAAETREAGEVTALIGRVAKDVYYSDLNRDPLASFEAALQRLNEELAEFAGGGRVGWVGHLSASLAVLAGRNLHLAALGNASAYLLRGGRLTEISEGLSQKKPNPLKSFVNIASGSLVEGDRLVLTTDALWKAVERDDLARLFSELSPARTIDRLRPDLQKSARLQRLAAILIELIPEEKLGKQLVETEPSEVVIDRGGGIPVAALGAAVPLLSRLRPHIGPRRPSTKAPESLPSVPAPEPEPESEPETPEEESKVEPTPKPEPDNRPEPETDHAPRPKSHRRGWNHPRFKTPGSGRRRLVLLAGLIVIGALLALGVDYGAKSTAKQEAAALTESRQLEAQAETALAAKKSSEALSLLEKAESTLEPALHSKDQARRSEASDLASKIQGERDQAQSVTRLKSPGLLADLSPLAKGADPIGLARTSDGTIYSTDAKTGALYAVNGSTPKLIQPGSSLRATSIAAETDDSIAMLLSPTGLAEYSLTDGYQKPSLTIGDWPASVDLAAFDNYLYLLDSTAGRVWKIPKTVGGFGKAQDYIGNENDQKIHDATSLAIDGSVYLLKRDGSIWKFTQGSRADFKLSGLPSPLPSSSHLFATADTTHLYALDPSAGRVVTLATDGAYQKSYVSDSFKGAKGLWIDEKESSLYVLAGTKIFKAPL